MNQTTIIRRTLLTSLTYLFIACIALIGTATADAGDDPIVGKWKWFSGEVKQFGPKGRAFGDGLHGNWKRIQDSNPPRYIIDWGNGQHIDTLTLTDHGRVLYGRNTNDRKDMGHTFGQRLP